MRTSPSSRPAGPRGRTDDSLPDIIEALDALADADTLGQAASLLVLSEHDFTDPVPALKEILPLICARLQVARACLQRLQQARCGDKHGGHGDG